MSLPTDLVLTLPARRVLRLGRATRAHWGGMSTAYEGLARRALRGCLQAMEFHSGTLLAALRAPAIGTVQPAVMGPLGLAIVTYAGKRVIRIPMSPLSSNGTCWCCHGDGDITNTALRICGQPLHISCAAVLVQTMAGRWAGQWRLQGPVVMTAVMDTEGGAWVEITLND